MKQDPVSSSTMKYILRCFHTGVIGHPTNFAIGKLAAMCQACQACLGKVRVPVRVGKHTELLSQDSE